MITKTMRFAPLISAIIPSFESKRCTLYQLDNDMNGDLKEAKILRDSKARNILFLTVIGTCLLMIGGIDEAYACSLSSHCYAR